MFCPVGTHKVFHLVCNLSFVFGKFHINKINYNDAAYIAEPQLAGYFSRCFEVGFKSILLLVVAYAFITAVHINYMQGFRMFNDKVSATREVYRFSKRCFYLACNTIAVKYRSAITEIGRASCRERV